MFFFILSKTIISDKSSNKYLSLFVSGMIFYIILNYYINITKPDGFLEYINEYFYYLLVLDFIISISLLNNDQVENFKEEDDDEDENFGQEKYSEEDKLKILQNLKNLQNKNNLDVKENNNEELFLKKETISNEKKEEMNKIVKENDEKEITKIKKNLKNEEIEKINNENEVKEDLNNPDPDDDIDIDNDIDIDIDIENENQNINVKSKNSEPLEDTELPIFDEK